MSEETIDLRDFMERVQDDTELLVELLDIYVEDYAVKRQQLTDAVQGKDATQLRSIAHSLKGASGNISATALREVFHQLEKKGAEGNLDGAEDLLDAVDKEFEKVSVNIRSLKERFKS